MRVLQFYNLFTQIVVFTTMFNHLVYFLIYYCSFNTTARFLSGSYTV